jgi:hypothetical protein
VELRYRYLENKPVMHRVNQHCDSWGTALKTAYQEWMSRPLPAFRQPVSLSNTIQPIRRGRAENHDNGKGKSKWCGRASGPLDLMGFELGNVNMLPSEAKAHAQYQVEPTYDSVETENRNKKILECQFTFETGRGDWSRC